MGKNHGKSTIMLTNTAKENLLRLWKSRDIQHHDLAFQMLAGFSLENDDLHWLWKCYHSLQPEQMQHATLRNLSQLNPNEIVQGRILSILLGKEDFAHRILSTFFRHNILRIPYSSLNVLPLHLYTFPHIIKELIWQDGEITAIDEHISQFKHLQRLDLRRQPIEFIHPNIALMPALSEIHLISTSFLPDELMDRKDIEIYTDAPY